MSTVATWPTVSVAINFSGSTWTDVTHYVLSISATRGRAYELGTASPGQLTISLDNHDGRFDPANASSPYYPNVLLYKKIRLVLTSGAHTVNAWQGYVSAWPTKYLDNGNWQMSPLTGIGVIGVLAQKSMLTVGEESLMNPAYDMKYWWDLSSTTSDSDTEIPERVSGIQSARIATFGGDQKVSIGNSPYLNPIKGLVGLGGATFTPDKPGYGLALSNESVIRLLTPEDGNFLVLPTVPWTLCFVIQTETKPPWITNYGNMYVLEFTDSGGGNGTGNQNFVRIGIGSAGEIHFFAKDSHAAVALSNLGYRVADGFPHFIALELSLVSGKPTFFLSVDGGTPNTISSGNSFGWTFTQLVVANLGAIWPTNEAASGSYGGLISNVVWYENSAFVTGGQFSGVGKPPDVVVNGFDQDLPGDRIANIMSLAGLPGLSSYASNGKALLTEAVTTGTTADQVIINTASYDGGFVYETGSGTLQFVSGTWRLNRTPTIVIGDGTGSLCPVVDLDISLDSSHIITESQVGTTKGGTYTFDDVTAQGKYGTWTFQLSSMAVHSDAYAISLAQWVVFTQANPKTRISDVVIDCGSNQSAMNLVMGVSAAALDLNVPVTVKHKPVGGQTISIDCWIESINYTIKGSDSFMVKLQLSPVDSNKYLFTDGAATLDNATWILAP